MTRIRNKMIEEIFLTNGIWNTVKYEVKVLNFNFYTPSRFITIFQQIFSPCISKKNQVPENEKHFDLKPKFNIVFVIWYSFDRFVCCSFYMLCIWYIHFTMYINFHVWIIILYISEECFFCVYMNKVKKIQTCNMSFFSM